MIAKADPGRYNDQSPLPVPNQQKDAPIQFMPDIPFGVGVEDWSRLFVMLENWTKSSKKAASNDVKNTSGKKRGGKKDGSKSKLIPMLTDEDIARFRALASGVNIEAERMERRDRKTNEFHAQDEREQKERLARCIKLVALREKHLLSQMKDAATHEAHLRNENLSAHEISKGMAKFHQDRAADIQMIDNMFITLKGTTTKADRNTGAKERGLIFGPPLAHAAVATLLAKCANFCTIHHDQPVDVRASQRRLRGVGANLIDDEALVEGEVNRSVSDALNPAPPKYTLDPQVSGDLDEKKAHYAKVQSLMDVKDHGFWGTFDQACEALGLDPTTLGNDNTIEWQQGGSEKLFLKPWQVICASYIVDQLGEFMVYNP